jgi:hypothetical protein
MQREVRTCVNTKKADTGFHIARRAALAVGAAGSWASWLRPAIAQQANDAAPMREAAAALLQVADVAQRRRLQAAFASPHRIRWHYVPGNRDGFALAQMSAPLAARAMDLVRASLSDAGLAKVEGVLTLATMPQSQRGAGSHALQVFGEPVPTGAWGWRLDGHHLSLNFTVLDDHIVSTTPLFFGADPMEVMDGPHRGLAPLFRERYMGRDLARRLNTSQRTLAAHLSRTPSDVQAGPGRAGTVADARGVPFSELTDETQRHLMLGLAETYLDNLPASLARAHLARLAGPARDDLRFTWHGGLEENDAVYYRLHGPRLWIEYATRGQADHVHTLRREPG